MFRKVFAKKYKTYFRKHHYWIQLCKGQTVCIEVETKLVKTRLLGPYAVSNGNVTDGLELHIGSMFDVQSR